MNISNGSVGNYKRIRRSGTNHMKTSSYVNFSPCMVLCLRIKTGISKQNNKAHVHKENWRTSVPPFLSLQIHDYCNCQTIFDLPLLEQCLQFQTPFLQIYNLINFVVNKTFDSLLEVGFENSWLLQLPPLNSTSASKNLSATSLLVPAVLFLYARLASF